MASRFEAFSDKAGLDTRFKSSRTLGVISAGIIFLSAGLIQAQLIDVDFNENDVGANGPTMSGAAVLGTAGDQWNGISAGSGTGIPLIYANGSNSTVTMTFTSGGGWDANNSGGSTPFNGTAYSALMEDYLFNGNTPKFITLSGLATNAIYNLVLYNAADAFGAGRKTLFTVNGNTQSSTWNGTSSTLIAGVDYVQFSPALSDGSGNLVITYTGNGSLEGDINGFQIQASSISVMAQTNNAAAYTWTTLAGHPPNGSADGTADTIELNHPEGVALDGAGNVYVADSGNNTIRKITQTQVSSTIAGFAGIAGTNDGTGGIALFNFPVALAADSAGNLYVADQNNYTIRKLTPIGANWMVTTIAGAAGSSGTNDGVGGAARFSSPAGITVDNSNNLYVTDNNTVREITPTGTNWMVTTIAGLAGISGNLDDVGTAARFNRPIGIGVDNTGGLNSGYIYVADSGNNIIREMTPMTNSLGATTNWMVNTITTFNGSFTSPYGISVINILGQVYVTDASKLRGMSVEGQTADVYTLTDQSYFGTARGVASIYVGGVYNIYWADDADNVIRRYSNGSLSAWAGIPTPALNTSDVDGTGIHAQFHYPFGITVDSAGTVYVAEGYGETIRQITSAGEVSTISGTFNTSGSSDGVASSALYYSPWAVAQDINEYGTLLIADYGNNTIRQIFSSGGQTNGVVRTATTVGGLAGNPGSNDGNVPTHNATPTSRFNGPLGIAVGKGSGFTPQNLTRNYYVADAVNRTIRKIAWQPQGLIFGANWTVTTFAGSVGNAVTMDGTGNAASFYFPEGITADSAGNLYVLDADGAAGVNLIRKITTSAVVSTIAIAGTYYGGHLGIAVDSSGNNIYVPDYYGNTIKKFTLTGTNWVMSVIGGMDGIPGSNDGAGGAARFSNPTDIAVDSAGNLYVADHANGTIRKGVFTAYGAANATAYTQPAMNSSLMVTLTPPEANGQWRFPWEVAWRTNGQTAGNLVAGNYPVQFRPIPGWLAIPPSLTVAVTNGGTTLVTNQYYPTIGIVDTNTGGTLTVTLGYPPVGGWRFLGDTTSFYPSGFSTNLVAGTYLIQFAAVNGRVTPPNLSVQVQAGQTTYLSENYLLAGSPPTGVQLPYPVPAANISNLTDYPFGFNGQLQTDVGYGSGVAVQANVVLTAAHMVFNDQTLSYVSQAYWYFQREARVFEPEPLQARGWYVLSGYAAERTTDLQSGLYGPDQSTPQSRNFDVAALYFLSPAAGGGYGGYLPSDASPNPWLTGNSLKMLVGYPVDGSEFGDATIVPGEMYQTQPQPYALSLSTDTVTNQQEVYDATWFLSYPGNSGGPVYAQFNGYYYPAGVYLGTLYSGVTPYASAVRAIDSAVVNLITNAASLGDSGTNHTGGGVITFIPNQAISASHPGYLQFILGPPAAVAAGAGWKLQGDTNYSTATNWTRVLLSTNAVVVQFKPIAGWNLPANQAVSVVPAPPITIITNAFYTVINPTLVVNGMNIGITGTTNTTYRIERRTSLTTGTWLPVSTNTITSGGFNLVLPAPPSNAPAMFYRAVWLQ